MWPFGTERYRLWTPSEVSHITFDYIVVGGGTGGCVVASRLAALPNTHVLLVERGPLVDTWRSRVPLLSVDFRSASSPTYQWKSTSDGINPSGENMVAGKALGGSSKINAHVYTRAVPAEYNAWAESGRRGWDWASVEPYFKKSETSLTHGVKEHRGSKGLWQNQSLPEIHFKYSEELLNAGDALAIPHVPDIHDPSVPPYASGCFDVTVNQSGSRVSTFDSFLPPEFCRDRFGNLYICPNTVVCRLDVQSSVDGLNVVGVYTKSDSGTNAPEYYLKVTKEVIMCAGAIATPQILMLSGIGPAKHLESLDITTTKDMPGVGSNLQDHPCIPLIYKTPREDTLHALESSPVLIIKELFRYVVFGRGLLLSPNPQVGLFALSKLLDKDSRTKALNEDTNSHTVSNIPDIEITPIPYNTFDDTLVLDKKDGITTLVCVLLKPKSSGTVRLRSLDPRDRPACELNFLSRNEDYEVLRKGLRLCLALSRKMREQGYPLRDHFIPQSESDEDLDSYIQKGIKTTFHYSCTCKMAPEVDSGVVDDRLRVHGIRGLRIADASIFPVIPSAHPQAPVVMVAERCADFIKEDYSVG